MSAERNIDTAVVDGFGDEWDAFDQIDLPASEHQRLFDGYFSVFPKAAFTSDAEGFDLGCGSGRWAALVAPQVGKLHCIDPSPKALAIAKRRLGTEPNIAFHVAGADTIPLADNSQDFGYSLGVLHHIPDTAAAMRDCVRKLKPGAPFLVYLYYAFDNRPGWFRALWSTSEMGRRTISRLPFTLRKSVTEVIAALVYWPLARAARVVESGGFNVTNLPLSFYRNESFYTMRTDALDRFGTRLEQRFTRAQITQMMTDAGLSDVVFREEEPYWTACGRKNL
jgi:ubiquinone/menaquinone biosynthesis C-methylase UbiE